MLHVNVGNDHMTGHNYLDFLKNELPEQLEHLPSATWVAMYFQHDEAPSHYTRLAMQHLNDTFPNCGLAVAVPLSGHQDFQT
jgi:hypothetical protein